jgi:hypothetical protein
MSDENEHCRRKAIHPELARTPQSLGTLLRHSSSFRHFLLLCNFVRLPAGAFLFNLL